MHPNVGVQIKAAGRDAIGQTFNTTGTVRPTNVEYTRSTSTVQVPKIRKWEWPVQFEIGEQLLNVVFSGVKVDRINATLCH